VSQQGTGKDAFWYTGRNAVIRSVATDRRKREGHKIVVLPSDGMVERNDEPGTPKRKCRWGGQQCQYETHFGCGIRSRYNKSAQVCLSARLILAYVCRGPEQHDGDLRATTVGNLQPGRTTFALRPHGRAFTASMQSSPPLTACSSCASPRRACPFAAALERKIWGMKDVTAGHGGRYYS
jgi:hypothetical protein